MDDDFDETDHEFDDFILRTIGEHVAQLQNSESNQRPASTYTLALIVSGVAARYVLLDEPLHLWMGFVDGALILAVGVLVLEASIKFVMSPPGVQAKFKMGGISNVMTWLAVMSGACGFVVGLCQRIENGSMTVRTLWPPGLVMVLDVMMGSIALIVLGYCMPPLRSFGAFLSKMNNKLTYVDR